MAKTAPSLRLEHLEAREVPATFTVTNTSNLATTAGSLPWAVAQANANPDLDTIAFQIGTFGANTRQYINLNSGLALTTPIIIDGETQEGWSRGNLAATYNAANSPFVTIVGNNVPGLFTFSAGSSASRMQGLAIYGFTSYGILLQDGSNNNIIRNNWIGHAVDIQNAVYLTTNLPNASNAFGVAIQSDFNVLFNNTISGVNVGVLIGDGPGSGLSATFAQTNGVFSNRIGTNPLGTSMDNYGNTGDGIQLGVNSQGNFIGWDPNWTTATFPQSFSQGNVISGNGGMGVNLRSPTTSGNVVYRNTIGLNIARTATIGNGGFGVQIHNGATGNAIGGAFGGNVISGNFFGGITLGSNWSGEQGAAVGNWVQNNIIGLNGQQTAIMNGQGIGITITNGSSSNVVQGNVIAGNQSHGVWINSAQGNNITNNWIGKSSSGVGFANANFGILLLQGASFNFVGPNDFGLNTLGRYFVDRLALGNAF